MGHIPRTITTFLYQIENCIFVKSQASIFVYKIENTHSSFAVNKMIIVWLKYHLKMVNQF